jgi:hypothetical protein
MPNNHGGAVDAAAFVGQLDRSTETDIRGKRVRVTTKSGSVYVIDDAAVTISKNGEEPQVGFVQGATFGGSMLMPGKLLVDAYMEFVITGQGTFTSTLVQSIEVLP